MTLRIRSANIVGALITATGMTTSTGINVSSQSSEAYNQANGAFDHANTAYSHAGNAFNHANNAHNQANTAYGQANTARSDANTTFATVNTSFGTVNTAITNAHNQANTARSDANTTFATVNTTFGTINTNYQAAYSQANTARSDANTTFATVNTTFSTLNTSAGSQNTAITNAHDQANSARGQANTAYAQANAAYAAANLRVSTSGGSISGDLAITGNLTVQGNATTINVSNLSVNDSMILLATGGVGDSNDIGFIGHIQRGATDTHAGLIRKATENRFYLFDNYEVEPTNNVIDVTGNNFRVGNIRLGIINANSFVTSAGLDVAGQANAAYTQANAARSDLNTTFATINTTFSTSNTIDSTQNTWIANLNTATGTINSHLGTINTTFGTLNTNIGTAYTQANNAYAAANNRVATVSGTSGRIISSGTTAITLDLATAGAGAASYSSGISALTIDAYGRVTSVTGSAGYATTSSLSSYLPLAGGTMTGQLNIGTATNLAFGSATRQMIDLWSTSYGIGVQSSTQYYRTGGRFSWFRGGIHSNTENDAGSGGTVAMTLDSSSILSVTGDVRAPIFYDSNDTNYFIDPASTSRVNVLQFSSGATAGPYFYYGNNQQNLYFRGNASTDVGMSFFDSSGNWRAQIYAASGNYGFLNGNWSGWDIRKVPSGSLFLNNQSTYYIDGSEIYYNRVYGVTDIRSPIFYDNNNTSYYTDPASTSQLNYAAIQNSISGEGYRFTHPQGGYYVNTAGTVTGAFKIKLPTARLHSSTMLQFKVKIYEYATGQTHEFIFSGYNYGGGYWVNISATQLTDYGRGAFAIRYGSDSTGNCIWIGETGTTWSYPQVYVTDVLTGYSGYSNDWGNGWSVTLVTSFNTVDTSRTASLVKTVNNASNWAFADYATIFYDTDNTGYYINPTGSARLSTIYCGDVYNDLGGWFRNYGATGIYNQSYNIHFYAESGNYWSLNSNSGLKIRDGYAGNVKGFLYYDGNGFGLLHSSGGWAVRTTTSLVEAYNSFYAPIMYDSSDSSFYCDPNGTSYLVYTNTRNLAFRGVGGDSGATQDSYGIYQEPGAWSHPYPDLVIGYHTGIKIGGYYGYNGTRFYNNNPASGSLIASIGDGDSALRSYDNIIAYASDGRLKENIQPITNAIEKVKKITGMTFDWKPMVRDLGFEPSNVHEAGVIAQDVEAVLPEAVDVAPFDYDWKQPNKSKSGEKYLTVKYEKLVPLLIQAIKEQQEQIEELKNMIKEKL